MRITKFSKANEQARYAVSMFIPYDQEMVSRSQLVSIVRTLALAHQDCVRTLINDGEATNEGNQLASAMLISILTGSEV